MNLKELNDKKVELQLIIQNEVQIGKTIKQQTKAYKKAKKELKEIISKIIKLSNQ